MSFIVKVLQEYHELSMKVGKLKTFVHGLDFKELEVVDRQLLLKQLDIMRAYLAVLDERIKRGDA